MEFWKNHVALRMILMTVFFVAGMALIVAGWKMTGQLVGLGIMIVGVILLVTTLMLYNKPFEQTTPGCKIKNRGDENG